MTPFTAKRRDLACSMRRGGMKIAAIAGRLGAPYSTVWKNLAACGLTAHRGPSFRDCGVRLARLAVQGKTARQAARELRTTPDMARKWAARLGVTLAPEPAADTSRRLSEAARRAYRSGAGSGGEVQAERARAEAGALGWPDATCRRCALLLEALFLAPGGLTAVELSLAAGYAVSAAGRPTTVALRILQLKILGLIEAAGRRPAPGRGAGRDCGAPPAVYRLTEWARGRRSSRAGGAP